MTRRHLTPVAGQLKNNRGIHETRRTDREALPSVEDLIRFAHAATMTAELPVSRAKVAKLCRHYVNRIQPTGQMFVPWFAANITTAVQARAVVECNLYQSIGYADPTGDKATQNVDRDLMMRAYRKSLRSSERYRTLMSGVRA